MLPTRNVFILFASTKRTGSSPEGCDPLDSGDGSKLYRLCFFVILPALVPTPACGATHFFGCFEPVRKGCCSADARPLFFENGRLYSKLTGANAFKKGGCTLSLLLWKFVFAYADLMFRDKSRFLAFVQSDGALIDNFDLSQGFAFL